LAITHYLLFPPHAHTILYLLVFALDTGFAWLHSTDGSRALHIYTSNNDVCPVKRGPNTGKNAADYNPSTYVGNLQKRDGCIKRLHSKKFKQGGFISNGKNTANGKNAAEI
jgi:hypothetical protein